MYNQLTRYNHTCEEYNEGEELASPFLRFCPIGVKVTIFVIFDDNAKYNIYLVIYIGQIFQKIVNKSFLFSRAVSM